MINTHLVSSWSSKDVHQDFDKCSQKCYVCKYKTWGLLFITCFSKDILVVIMWKLATSRSWLVGCAWWHTCFMFLCFGSMWTKYSHKFYGWWYCDEFDQDPNERSDLEMNLCGIYLHYWTAGSRWCMPPYLEGSYLTKELQIERTKVELMPGIKISLHYWYYLDEFIWPDLLQKVSVSSKVPGSVANKRRFSELKFSAAN